MEFAVRLAIAVWFGVASNGSDGGVIAPSPGGMLMWYVNGGDDGTDQKNFELQGGMNGIVGLVTF